MTRGFADIGKQVNNPEVKEPLFFFFRAPFFLFLRNEGAPFGSCLKTGQHSIFVTIKIKNTRMLDTITIYIDGFIDIDYGAVFSLLAAKLEMKET